MNTTPSPPSAPLATTWPLIAIPWLLALPCVVLTRFRAQWAPYQSLHQWLAARGVPDAVRNCDNLIIYTLIAFLGAFIVHRLLARGKQSDAPAALLGLRRGRAGWLAVCLIALAPMVLGGLIISFRAGLWSSDLAEFWPRVFKGVIRAPIMEELFFRGLLVGVVAAAAIGWTGWRFWLNASLAAAIFASIHIDWSMDGVARGWPNLIVTFVGGMWYAWLLSRWRSLWVPMILHAGMNLGWMLAAAEGGAGGGRLIENLLRVATITIATWLTVRTPRQN